ncbi:hypothetical protein D7027_21560 [Ochrobactrum intermedium]|uniref:hypothetical protein n=1 Tax=Brucella intermedia TaxID=94625 RepID=UPI00128BF7E4|nr:hypothetical protein [Brucella intermedia]MPR64362.1 hypothetical protein [Brucella intermedia]
MSGNDDKQVEKRRIGFAVCISGMVFASLGLGYTAALYKQDRLTPLLSAAADVRTDRKDRIVKDDNPFQNHVLQARMKACATAFPAMGNLLTQNSQFMVQTKWNKQNPDQHMTQALVGMRYDSPDYKGPSIGIMVAAPINGNCETNAVRVTPFDMSCEEVVQRFMGNSTMSSRLQELPIYDTDDGSQVVMVPSGKNCVAVSVAYSDNADGKK